MYNKADTKRQASRRMTSTMFHKPNTGQRIRRKLDGADCDDAVSADLSIKQDRLRSHHHSSPANEVDILLGSVTSPVSQGACYYRFSVRQVTLPYLSDVL
jgi:hypothetical protein